MRRSTMLLAFAATLLFTRHAIRADAPRQTAARLDTEVHVTLGYLLYLPADFESKEKWPLVVFLHGAGERGNDLELVKTHGPPKLIEDGKQFPFVVISPQCTKDRAWSTQVVELTALVNDVVKRYKIDEDRIYLTGLSMGGFGTWSLAAYMPGKFAAIMPICGGGELSMAHRLAHMPIWVFHGAKDTAVPLSRSQQMVDALKDNKELKFTVYPDAGHDSWTETYQNPDVWDWLLKQNRKPKSP